MIKAAGFLLGQFGDLVIQTVVCRAFKEKYPDSHLTFTVGDKYKEILPLFFHHPHIDDFHIYEGYDNWPTQSDIDYINYRKFDLVFNGKAQPTSQDWYNYLHYAEEHCLEHGLNPPQDLSYLLIPWFNLYNDCKNVVTLSLFPSKGSQPKKGMLVNEAEELCINLKKKGFRPIQLGGKFEIKLENAESPHFSILEATKLMLSSKLHITADTCFSSVAAAYKHPTIGFYGLNYPNMVDCFSHLPPNTNASYIKNKEPNSIKAEEILNLVDSFK